MKKWYEIFIILFFSSSLYAKDCEKKVETYAKEEMKSVCIKKACKAKEIYQVTDLTGYPHLAKGELLFRISIEDRFFEVVVKKNGCKKSFVNEIGSSDDE